MRIVKIVKKQNKSSTDKHKEETDLNPYFSLTDKVYNITEQYPELIEPLVEMGYESLKNDALRKLMGRSVSLEMALKTRHLDVEKTEQTLVDVIRRTRENPDALRVTGVLPCPIRIQLMEKLNNWIEEHHADVSCDLQAASMGLDHIEEQVKNSKSADDLADIYLSAGFGLFFDRSLLGHYSDASVFADLTGMEKLNSCFDNEHLQLKDPKHQYTILAGVPAVFMVNESVLDGREFPQSWSDLLSPVFENSIAMPVRDLDLFNALLLGIYSHYGENGVRALGRNLMSAMHPAEMVKTGTKAKKASSPAVTVMPYFFTLMNRENNTLTPVWPSDGAILSPIFLLSKASSSEKSQEFISYLASKEMGEVFCAGGKFPSAHPDVDNGLSPEETFLWPGWDFIYSHDIGSLLKETERIFFEASEETK